MVTEEQAFRASVRRGVFHAEGGCSRKVGPRGGLTITVERWRANGALKTWKTRPGEWRLPVKYGMGYRGGYSAVTSENAYAWHMEDDCPLGIR